MSKRSAFRYLIPRRLRRLLGHLLPVTDGLGFLLMFSAGHIPSHILRRAAYRLAGVQIGKDVTIHKGLELRYPPRVALGAGTVIGFDCILDGRGGLAIGDHVNLSSEAAIWTMQHDYTARDFNATAAPVTIGDRAWLSFRCTVLPGVKVGEGAVVAAGAVVSRDVPPYAVMAGVPAVQVAERPRDLSYRLGEGHPWFV